MPETQMAPVPKLATGIPGLDAIAHGGVPQGRAVVVAGTSGSGKTVFAAQFLAAGIRDASQPGVFVTCEEALGDLRGNVASFGWDVAAWEAAGSWRFVDASRRLDAGSIPAGPFDFTALLARIEAAVRSIGARRVAIDALDSLFGQFEDPKALRAELHRAIGLLGSWGVTTVMTIERDADYGAHSRRGVEEFVADNLILLRNVLSSERRRRTIEIVKFRGASHGKGEYGFSINAHGISVVPHLDIESGRPMTDERVSLGNAELDAMCDGGVFRESIVLVSGAAGSGKTLLTASFVAAGMAAGERCLVFAFEERREQWYRNARGWGYDFARMARDGTGSLQVVSAFPEVATLEDHLLAIATAIASYRPQRIAVDSLSALQRVATPDAFRKFVVSLSATLKHHGITSLLTSTTPTFLGGSSHTESHLSTVTDLIILLRHSEVAGALRRGLVVLKMRGSRHDHDVRECTVNGSGMRIGAPFDRRFGITADGDSGLVAGLDDADADRDPP